MTKDPKDDVVKCRVSAQEKALIEAAAAGLRMSVSMFVRSAAVERASEVPVPATHTPVETSELVGTTEDRVWRNYMTFYRNQG